MEINQVNKTVTIIEGDENADWILGALDSEKRKAEIKLIESITEKK